MIINTHCARLTASTECSAGLAAAQWLSLRLQLLAASIVVFVAGLGVAGAENALPSFASHMQGCAPFHFYQK